MFSERKCPTNEKSNEPKKLYLGNFGWKEISTGKTKAVEWNRRRQEEEEGVFWGHAACVLIGRCR